MNTAPHHNSESNMTVFLLGAIFNIMASTEWSSLADYALKAFVGGIIWLLFKLVGDYISHKFIGKRKDEDRS
jgi:heme/copper-type cytochrome/quinol oxidase subunit 3